MGEQGLRSAARILAAVLGASLAELAVGAFDRRRLAWPSSAILSGMIVGFVLGPATPWAVTAAVGILATIGKHLIATDRWHIFNPAALALLVSVPLFGTGQSWWGALPDLPWPFDLVLLGALVAATGVGAQQLGAGQAYLLLGVLVGNVALAVRRWLNQRQSA